MNNAGLMPIKSRYGFVTTQASTRDVAQSLSRESGNWDTEFSINPQQWLKYVMDTINTTSANNFKEFLPQFIDKNLLR